MKVIFRLNSSRKKQEFSYFALIASVIVRLKSCFTRASRGSWSRCCISDLIMIFFLAHEAQGADIAKWELYRRGYQESITLPEAVLDYNKVHRLDPVAQQYPKLDVVEIEPAVVAFMKTIPAHDTKRRAQLNSLVKHISHGFLPKGALISFQYLNKSRTVYWHDLRKLDISFYIILWLGLDENPPGEGEFNQKAFVTSVPIRYSARSDAQFLKQRKRAQGLKGTRDR